MWNKIIFIIRPSVSSIAKIIFVIALTCILQYIIDKGYLGKLYVPNNPIETSHVILTIFLVCIAWIQLSGLQKTAQSDFLMRIDDRYASKSILKARQIIQRLYRESNIQNPGAPHSVHNSHISIRIHEISENIDNSNEYIYLLNLLDFLETISYFANKGAISISDIESLMGPSMGFFFTIFTPRIEARRQKYQNNKYYCELEKLVKNMK